MSKAVWLALCLALTVGCGDDSVYIMSEFHELDGEERIFAGGGCSMAFEDERWGGSGRSGSTLSDMGGDFAVSEQTGKRFYTVIVKSGDTELARREYSEGELLSGDEDRFEVETLLGRRVEVAYWGGRDCDTSHVPHDE
jgi:hypothetical protein